MHKVIISLICCLLPALTFADTLAIRDDAPDHYVVAKGDTLWDISAKFFKDPWRWPQIWGLNKDAIKNPHWIYPGDVVVFDHQRGTLQVVPGGEVQAAAGPAAPESAVVAVQPPVPVAVAPAEEQSEGEEVQEIRRPAGAVRLSPRARAEPGEHEAIPSIPYGDIKPFLSQALVIEKNELNDAPVIIAGAEGRLMLSNTDIAYVKNLPPDKGLEYQIYRPGKPLVDPVSDKVLGYEANYLGNARVEKFDDVSTLRIYNATEEIYPGDRLLQSAIDFPENFIPRAPDSELSARVLKIVNGITMAGRQAVVILNQGRREGVQNGHVLALYRKGERVNGRPFGLRDVNLPNLRYGLVFVFRTFEHVSYGVVMQAHMPVELLDVAQTP